ncbi:MAG: glycosyltransferase family 39 protein [Deltaproteobacteria bacterium]|nr:glycosyltransferase family 39 protein [Deltaproteobacteria bacterium]
MIIKTLKQPFSLAILVVIIAVILLGAIRIKHYHESPDVLFLTNRADAQWIKYDSPFQLEIKPSSRPHCMFGYAFHVDNPVHQARINVQALKRFQLYFDGIKISSSDHDFDKWKQMYSVTVPLAVDAGPHKILIIVESKNSYPAVIAYSESLPVKTGPGWAASNDGKNWRMAIPASRVEHPEISEKFPSSVESLLAIWPYLAVIFIMVFIVSLFSDRWKNNVQGGLNRRLDPSHIRWALMFLWAVLAVNNMFKLNYQVGSDGWGHLEYIDYIVTRGSLPLAPEGWHMFQAPLNYILSAPMYALLIKWFDMPAVVKMMAIIPVICGLVQIEIVYRTAQLVFAEKKGLQIIAVITGSLLPIHTYACQYMGNEPLTGCFISLVILLCFYLIMPKAQERSSGYFILMGILWGLALLSKMTAWLLAPVLIIVIILHTQLVRKSLKFSLRSISIVFCVSIIISGWYYLRNYIELGSPFPGVFGHSQMLQWWQDPGYRTWSHVLSFGQSLCYPVYAGLTSFWDMFYSTLWLDGINSGLIDFIPWNKSIMIAGSLLALLPSVFILTAVLLSWRDKEAVHRNAVIFSAGIILLFLAAMMDMYIVCPIYSRTKASYTLGLLPCYAVLVAAGAEPFLRNKIIRSLALAFFVCWAFAAYAAYFVVSAQ